MLEYFKHRWTRKQVALALGLALVCCVVAATVFAFGQYQKISVSPTVTSTSPSPSPVDTRYAHLFNQGNPYSVLLMGYGGGSHEGGKLTDSMILVYAEPKIQHVTLISIPRDVWISLPVKEGEESWWKVNAAYAIGADDRRYTQKPLQYTGEAGGGELAKYAINKMTGLPVTKFATIDFRGFTRTIDTLGGVTVKVERTLDDPQYPIEGKEKDPCDKTEADIQAMTATMSATDVEKAFTCRYEHLHFDVGKQLMTGETALKYARSRHGGLDGGDFNRAARQRNLLLAVKERVLVLNFLPKAIPFATSLSGSLTTDMTLSDMENFLSFQEELKNYSITSLPLTDKNVFIQARSRDGQFILQPRAGEGQWEAVHAWIKEEIASASAQATTSAEVKPRN